MGLLLLLLRICGPATFLWAAVVPLGEAVCRNTAQLVYHDSEWIIAQEADEAVRVTKGDVNKLEEFIRALGGM